MSGNILMFDNAKKKKFIDKVSYLGIKKIPYLLIQTGKERIRAYSGNLAREEISKLCQLLSVEGIGIYLAKETEDAGMRMSMDALHLMKDQISSNIVEFNEAQIDLWFLGKNVELTPEQTEASKNIKNFVAVKSAVNGDLIGTGKISQDKKVVMNFLPKERTIKQNF